MLRISRWAERDPLSAAAWVEKTTHGELRGKLLKVVAASFAESDLQASIAWAEGLDAASEREAVLREITRQAAVSDPRAALEIAGRITDGKQCREAVLECLREWARHDPLQAAEYAGRLPGPVSRDEALASVASARASSDPAGAATLAVREIRDEAAFFRALPALLSEAAKSDPTLMEEWVRSFADGPVKELARAELARIRRGLHPSPASLPGEAVEDRTSLPNQTKKQP